MVSTAILVRVVSRVEEPASDDIVVDQLANDPVTTDRSR
jgi:hypothetical protein